MTVIEISGNEDKLLVRHANCISLLKRVIETSPSVTRLYLWPEDWGRVVHDLAPEGVSALECSLLLNGVPVEIASED